MAEESLFAGESKNIEYKVAVPKKSEKYMKTVVAFANGNGGKIVFGIDDKTLEIVGMKWVAYIIWITLMLKSLEDTIQYSHMAKRLISEKSTAKAIRFIYYF